LEFRQLHSLVGAGLAASDGCAKTFGAVVSRHSSFLESRIATGEGYVTRPKGRSVSGQNRRANPNRHPGSAAECAPVDESDGSD